MRFSQSIVKSIIRFKTWLSTGKHRKTICLLMATNKIGYIQSN